MIKDAQVEAAARRFALLSDPTRLRILGVLIDRGETNVGSVAEAAGTSHFNASQHLSRLAAAGMVARRRAGSSAYYRISDPVLPALCELVCSSLAEAGGSQVTEVLAAQAK